MTVIKRDGKVEDLEPKKILTDGSKVRVSDPQYETGNLFFTSCRLGEYRMTICSPYLPMISSGVWIKLCPSLRAA